jgi:hypothetical protein
MLPFRTWRWAGDKALSGNQILLPEVRDDTGTKRGFKAVDRNYLHLSDASPD